MYQEIDLINNILLADGKNQEETENHEFLEDTQLSLNVNLEINDEYNHDETNETCDWSFNDIEIKPPSFILNNNEKNNEKNNDNDNDDLHEEVNLNDLYHCEQLKIKNNIVRFPRNHSMSSSDNEDKYSNEADFSDSDSDSDSDPDSDNDSINGENNINLKLLNKVTSYELNNDLKLLQNLVKNQNEIRINVLRRVLYSYFKQYIVKPINSKPVLTKKLIDKVVEMGEVLDLENMLGAIIAEILLNNKKLDGLLISKYSHIIGAFLSTYTSQDNFLNQLMIIINNNPNLIDDEKITELFVSCITNRLISRSMLKNWSQKLNEDNAEKLASELNIDVLFVQMVDSIINN